MGFDNRRRRYELESILETVLVEGYALIPRYKLPTLLGRERERGEIWNELIELYEDLGGETRELRGKRVGDKLFLSRFDFDKNPYDSDDQIITPRPVK